MMDFTMALAKRDFERGLLVGARIVSIIDGRWGVELISSLGVDGSGWLIDAKDHKTRQMRTLDAAVSALQQVGFDVKQLII